jgi:tRNA dimethylallyltransferase
LERADQAGPPERLNAWLRALDPTASQRIDVRNRRRVLRAIEVTLATGQPFSQSGQERASSLPAVWIGLRLDRPALHERVERRLDAMLADGWPDEVRTLLAMGYSPELPSMSATGYAELAHVLRGDLALDEATLRIRYATHAFIRRQETWMRAEPRITWFDADDSSLVDRVYGYLSTC